MPIDYKKYPKDWKRIRSEIIRRAEGRCELCNAEQGKPHWKTGSKVVLTVAHLNQKISDLRRYNLRALCQRCHLLIDLPWKIDKRLNKKKERLSDGHSN
jgi:5-methylcytosine-specific restriction endonuclease McrA